MLWKSNAAYNADLESGSIFDYKRVENDCSRLVVIHRIQGLDGWYLNCSALGIRDMELKSEDFSEAVEESKGVVLNVFAKLQKRISAYCNDTSEVEYVRY
jgi:hypothetical protein